MVHDFKQQKLPHEFFQKISLNKTQIQVFQQKVYTYFSLNSRILPWRITYDPYHVFVSEVMLQQTQVPRVVDKFHEFITHLPTIHSLALAAQRDVLFLWQGLGYNRRALYLLKSAQIIVDTYEGMIPSNPQQLITLPGIGKATAASICAFAYNMPTIFIETNIRTVFIHEFFSDHHNTINDSSIEFLVQQTLDTKNPRKWYSALMDYGTSLKKKYSNPSRKSAHHVTQSSFIGSNRQLRGEIIRLLLCNKQTPLSTDQCVNLTSRTKKEVEEVVVQLQKEGFLEKRGDVFILIS